MLQVHQGTSLVSSAEIDDDCVAKFTVNSEIFARVLFSRNFACICEVS